MGRDAVIVTVLASALGCAQTTATARGDGGADALTLDANCDALDAQDLRRVGTRGWGVITLQLDTRATPWDRGLPVPPTPCAPQRARAVVYAYTAEVDGPVRVLSPSLRVEVFRDCQDGFALLGCGDDVGVSLRRGQRVYLVFSSDPRRGRPGGIEGVVRVERGPFLAEGERCDEARDPAAFCGPGLACSHRGRCSPRLYRTCRADRVDCGPEQICQYSDGPGLGVCVDVAALGERCEANLGSLHCARGLVCADGRNRRWHICVRPASAGETCAFGRSIDTNLAAHCAPGLRCDARHRCVPLAREGEACRSNGPMQCVDGATCIDGRCARVTPTPYGACEERGRPVCPDGFACEGQRCFPRDVTPVGARCDSVRRRCTTGQVCAAFQCATPGGVGSLCSDDRLCDQGLRCNAFGRCARDGTRGERCRDDAPRCDGDDACLNGLCTAKVDPSACADRSNDGALCGEDQVCHAGTCAAFGLADGPCTPPFARDRRAPCPGGLVCGATGRCAPPLAPGAMCDRFAADDPCGVGARCVDHENACRTAGTRDAPCRPEERPPRCDAGLRCQFDRCVPAALDAGTRCGVATAACREGLACVGDGFACTPPGAPGGSCRADEPPCDAGLRCVGADRARWCAAPRGPGEPCDEPRTYCREGGSCGADGVCGPPGREGARCRVTAPWCDGDLACDVSRRCERRRPDGEPCASSFVCGAHSWCVAGRCARVDDAEGLAPCSVDLSCEGGLTCLEGRCREVLAPGGRCDRRAVGRSVCPENYYCGVDDRCVLAGGADLPCRTRGRPCDDGLFCDFRTCRVPQRPGDLCPSRDFLCAPESWCVGEAPGGRGVCTPFGAEGTPCRFDEPPCEAGLVCDRARVLCVRP